MAFKAEYNFHADAYWRINRVLFDRDRQTIRIGFKVYKGKPVDKQEQFLGEEEYQITAASVAETMLPSAVEWAKENVNATAIVDRMLKAEKDEDRRKTLEGNRPRMEARVFRVEAAKQAKRMAKQEFENIVRAMHGMIASEAYDAALWIRGFEKAENC